MAFNFRTILLFLSMLILFSVNYLSAQVPKGVPQPHENEPVNINSISDVIIYIVLPIGLIILYIVWRKRIARKKREMEEKKKEQDGSNGG